MDLVGTRRGFLRWTNSALASLGLAGTRREAASTTRRAGEGEDYYDKLGVAKIINAAGTYTALTASIMPSSVQAAVARAARHPVRLNDLQKAAGEYIAKKLHCDAALVSDGASSALTLGTAGAVMVANKCGVRD